jgi:hypothetical protein
MGALTAVRLIGSSGSAPPCNPDNSLDADDYSRISDNLQDEKHEKPLK